MPTEATFVQRSMIATTGRSFTVVITTSMIETVNRLVIVTRMAHGHHWAIRLPFGHVNSACVLAPTSTLLAESLFHLPAVECTCYSLPPARKRDVSACYEAAERPETVASQPASYRRRPLEVAIFIVDGTNKYQLNGREVTYPIIERMTTILALHGEHSTTTLMAAFQFSVSINIVVTSKYRHSHYARSCHVSVVRLRAPARTLFD